MTFPLIHTIYVYIWDAENSSRHAHPCFKHYSSSGQMSFWADVLRGKCLLGKCLSGQMSFWANVLLGKCLISGQMSFWANVFCADVFWANVVLGKCLWANVYLGKCLSGQMSSVQMSSGQMSFWANVSGQMSLGKCRMGKCRVTVSSCRMCCCKNDINICSRTRLYHIHQRIWIKSGANHVLLYCYPTTSSKLHLFCLKSLRTW
jgi:hypothetical protein